MNITYDKYLKYKYKYIALKNELNIVGETKYRKEKKIVEKKKKNVEKSKIT
jgi:hypothetical protein